MFRTLRWYTQSFYKKHKAVLGSSVIGGIVLMLILSQVLKYIPLIKQTRYVGRVGRFTLAQIPRDIQDKMSVGLTRTLEDGEVVPALASAFRSEESGKAYRFTIRPGITWQDGKSVSTDDINYSFADTQVSRSQNDIVFRTVAKKQDETAQEPVLPTSFTSKVSQPLFRRVDTRNIFFQKRQHIIGLGEYRMVSLVSTAAGIQELTIESDTIRIVYRFFPTEHAAIVAYKRGEVDELEGMSDLEDITANASQKITEVSRPDQFIGIFFNLTYKDGENMVFASKQLRQALNYALTKPSEHRVVGPIPSVSWAAVKDAQDLDLFTKDKAQAIDLLLKAETPTKLTIDLQTSPAYTAIADQVKKEWEELGDDTAAKCAQSNDIPKDQCENKRIRVTERINGFVDTTNFAVLIAGQQIPKDPDQYNLWHSTQATNITHYKNPKIDKLLEDGRRSTERDERRLIYQEFERLLIKDVPVIFWQSVQTKTVVRTRHLPIL